MKPLTKKQSASFHKKCISMFKNELCAVETNLHYNLVIETNTGPLYIRVDDDNQNCYSVFGNFLGNEETAEKKFGHWKNNQHLTAELSEAEAIQQIKNHYLTVKNA